MSRLPRDLLGGTFGLLAVVAREGSTSDGRAKWLCICVCGTQKTVAGINLVSGSTRSCGCMTGKWIGEKTKARASSEQRVESKRRRSFRNYRDQAPGRDLVFELNYETFIRLVEQSCTYCGLTPAGGLDRRDSTEGYTVANVVPSCWQCNRAKFTYSVPEFLEWASRVHNHSTATKEVAA